MDKSTIPISTNWLTVDKNILIGGCPYDQKNFQLILNQKIDIFINLMSKREKRYKYEDYNKIKYYNFHIPDLTTLSDKEILKIAHIVINFVNEGKKIFIHCKGGHGRTGALSGILLHKLYPNMTYTEIIQDLNKRHKTRKYKPNMSIPQTAQQFNQIHRIVTGKDDIFFYDKKDINFVFSNYYTLDDKNTKLRHIPLFNLDGQDWFSTEAYYQSNKFTDTPIAKIYKDLIRQADRSHYTFLMGNMKGNIRPSWVINTKTNKTTVKDSIDKYKNILSIRTDWDEIKDKVMLKALLAKFTQNEDLFKLLLSTDNKLLVEYSSSDIYWGDYWNKNGKNILGLSLIKLRDCLRPYENIYINDFKNKKLNL